MPILFLHPTKTWAELAGHIHYYSSISGVKGTSYPITGSVSIGFWIAFCFFDPLLWNLFFGCFEISLTGWIMIFIIISLYFFPLMRERRSHWQRSRKQQLLLFHHWRKRPRSARKRALLGETHRVPRFYWRNDPLIPPQKPGLLPLFPVPH